jgi:hypothetical protein
MGSWYRLAHRQRLEKHLGVLVAGGAAPLLVSTRHVLFLVDETPYDRTSQQQILQQSIPSVVFPQCACLTYLFLGGLEPRAQGHKAPCTHLPTPPHILSTLTTSHGHLRANQSANQCSCQVTPQGPTLHGTWVPTIF